MGGPPSTNGIKIHVAKFKEVSITLGSLINNLIKNSSNLIYLIDLYLFY